MRVLMTAALLAASLAQAQATCISGRDILYTDRPNDKTIVFTLKDKQVYRNDLPVPCPNLKVSVDGFSYQPTDPSSDELCDGMVVFRLNDLGHAACIAGNFTRVK